MCSIRCRCGKIICQISGVTTLPKIEEAAPGASEEPAAIILCRHCKRYVVLRVPAITSITLASEMPAGQGTGLVQS